MTRSRLPRNCLQDFDRPTHDLLKSVFPEGICMDQLPVLLQVLRESSDLTPTQLARTVSVALGRPYFEVWPLMVDDPVHIPQAQEQQLREMLTRAGHVPGWPDQAPQGTQFPG